MGPVIKKNQKIPKVLVNMFYHPLDNSYAKVISRQEHEFYAEDELIEIIPNFSISNDGMVDLLSGRFGPFRVNMRVTIPLWFALSLRREGRCTILIPQWMNIDNL